MTFLVLCPSCRHQVSVQENTAGQLARCPYCARPFKVPAPPSPAAPPRVQAVAKKPETGRGVAPRPPMPNPRKGRAPVDDPPPVYSERSGSRGKILLGVLSFGIVGLLLAAVGGVAVFLLKDRLAEPQPTQKQASQVASARKKPAAPVSAPTERTAPHDSAAHAEKNPDPPAEKPSAPKRQPEAEKPLLEEAPEPEPLPKTVTPKPERAPKIETPKPDPPAKVEKENPPSPPKVKPIKPDAPSKVEAPKSEPAPQAPAAKSESPALPSVGRRRLSGDQVYSRLVKSTVFVMTSDSWGSGSLIHRDRKLVLTNYHVVGDNSQVSVSFPRYDGAGKLIVAGEYYLRAFKNGEFIRGKVLKVAKGQDLALVQLDKVPEGMPVLKLSARSASPGQTVHSVGNPGASDARWSYTSGTVRQVSHKVWKAKLDKNILTFDSDVVETQSPTNPGDSGGPLVNDQLELVAVTQGANVTAREVSLFIDIAEVKKLLQSCDVRLEDVVAAPGDGPEGGSVDASDVLALGKRLEDKDAATRAEAARRLSECGADARPAARALMKALHDDDPLVRQNAATALGKLGPDAQDLVRKDVFAALQDADAGVRTAALQALADLGPPEQDELPTLLPVLREAIKRKKLKVCLHVARSLARLGANAKDAVPELRLLLKADDREVRLQTLSTLRKIGPAARSADADVAECLQSEDRSVRMQAALVLAAIDPKMRGAGKEGLSVLILALKPGSLAEVDDAQAKERVKEISAQLVKVGEPAAERLLSAIKNEFRGGRVRSEDGALNGQARLAALKIIAEIGPEAYSTSMLSALADLQRTDPYPGVREAARQAYAKIQNKN